MLFLHGSTNLQKQLAPGFDVQVQAHMTLTAIHHLCSATLTANALGAVSALLRSHWFRATVVLKVIIGNYHPLLAFFSSVPISCPSGLPFAATGEGSVVSFSAFWVTVAALGATVLTAWGGYGKNSDKGLSLKRVGPFPALKVKP